MKDPRITKLAQQLVEYSVNLKKGEMVLVEAGPGEVALVKELVKMIYQVGAIPFVKIQSHEIQRALLMNLEEKGLSILAEHDARLMKQMTAYIGIRGADNISELSDVPLSKKEMYMKLYTKPVHGELRVPHTKWCVLRYPGPSMAQLAQMSTESFEDFYFDVCCFDYAGMSKAMGPLVSIMEKTEEVRLQGDGTDLTFSIKGLPAIKCDGKMNIPDGEVFTAPVKDSVNGVISYNTPAVYQGFTFENIKLEFKNGRIVKAVANDTRLLNKVLDTDEGARYIGEFALGVNPNILHPMNDTLFDEKISGSIHLTPGRCYDVCNNGNQSAIHWDLVYIQRPEYGGGEILFDGQLIRKDGIFVLEELQGLNPKI
jgi:aminopeptidase